jgi:hypothetical protein
MSLIINNNYGTINHIENSVVTISNGQTTLEQQKKDAPQTEVQEVAFEDVRREFALLTEQCRKENKVSAVESELRAACKGTAVSLWRVIRTNEALGYLSADRLSTAKVYRAFTDYFGALPYTERNFRDARDRT